MLINLLRGRNSKKGRKPVLRITGTLMSVLKPGKPAVYLYQGQLIRTLAVEAILEASVDHVRFETQNGIYKISFFEDVTEGELAA